MKKYIHMGLMVCTLFLLTQNGAYANSSTSNGIQHQYETELSILRGLLKAGKIPEREFFERSQESAARAAAAQNALLENDRTYTPPVGSGSAPEENVSYETANKGQVPYGTGRGLKPYSYLNSTPQSTTIGGAESSFGNNPVSPYALSAAVGDVSSNTGPEFRSSGLSGEVGDGAMTGLSTEDLDPQLDEAENVKYRGFTEGNPNSGQLTVADGNDGYLPNDDSSVPPGDKLGSMGGSPGSGSGGVAGFGDGVSGGTTPAGKIGAGHREWVTGIGAAAKQQVKSADGITVALGPSLTASSGGGSGGLGGLGGFNIPGMNKLNSALGQINQVAGGFGVNTSGLTSMTGEFSNTLGQATTGLNTAMKFGDQGAQMLSGVSSGLSSIKLDNLNLKGLTGGSGLPALGNLKLGGSTGDLLATGKGIMDGANGLKTGVAGLTNGQLSLGGVQNTFQTAVGNVTALGQKAGTIVQDVQTGMRKVEGIITTSPGGAVAGIRAPENPGPRAPVDVY